jgi:hypothetical protein
MGTSLKQVLLMGKRTEFKFTHFEQDFSESDGSRIAVLHLESPIPTVTGSQTITDGITSEKVVAYDVTTVKVHETDMDDSIIVNDDGISGSVSSDMRLDVAKRSGDVWLTATSFAKASREMREDRQTSSREKMLESIRLRREAAMGTKKPETPTVKKEEKVQPVVTK